MRSPLFVFPSRQILRPRLRHEERFSFFGPIAEWQKEIGVFMSDFRSGGKYPVEQPHHLPIRAASGVLNHRREKKTRYAYVLYRVWSGN